jgi:hypothetical protein
MKYISTLILFTFFSFYSSAQNSKLISKIYHKKILNSIAGRYANVDVTMGYAKGTGGIIIGNPNQSKYSLFNDFSFSIHVLRGQDQQFGKITNLTIESNNLNDFLFRFDWKNKRTDQGTISGEIQLFYSLTKDRYETYFINNSSSIFKIFWRTELDGKQKDSINSIIKILYKNEFQNESQESKLNRVKERENEKEKEISYQKYKVEKRTYELDKIRMEMGLPPLEEVAERKLDKAKQDALIAYEKENRKRELKRYEETLKQIEIDIIRYKDSILNIELDKLKKYSIGDLIDNKFYLINKDNSKDAFFLYNDCIELSEYKILNFDSELTVSNNFKDYGLNLPGSGWRLPNYNEIKQIELASKVNSDLKKMFRLFGILYKENDSYYNFERITYSNDKEVTKLDIPPKKNYNGYSSTYYRICPVRFLKDVPILSKQN